MKSRKKKKALIDHHLGYSLPLAQLVSIQRACNRAQFASSDRLEFYSLRWLLVLSVLCDTCHRSWQFGTAEVS